MARLNGHYQQLRTEYIFPIIDKKLEELRKQYPDSDIINLGVGDIALPLAPSIIQAICNALQEMGNEGKIHGYGPCEGYLFLREAIAKNEYAAHGIDPEEIFISDGINTDVANIQEIFSLNSWIGVPDPTYPVYRDSNIMAGRAKKIVPLPCAAETGFLPVPPSQHCDLIYLCSPNNPTGVAMNKKQLAAWITYARQEKAVIIYDNAYAAFIRSPDVPYSIYEIEGAKEVAIEMRSFSKNAGFTGLRCSYTVLPREIQGRIGRKKTPLHSLWIRRQNTKYNGVAYPIQRGAEAVYSEEGKRETKAQVDSYLSQGRKLREGLTQLGQVHFGGIDSPYIWWKTPNGKSSWEFFDLLLEKCHMLLIPGRGFGPRGEGYMRLSTFTTNEKVAAALQRVEKIL